MAFLLVLFFFAPSAHAAHGIALFGTLKYPAGFKHFNYVNPKAPKGGTLKLSYSGPFDSVNPYIIKGVAAPGVSQYLFQTLMTASYDEPQSFYGLIARDVVVAPDRSYADFTLNKRARWHDGKPITTDDVIWTLSTLKEKGHPIYRVMYQPITAREISPGVVRFDFDDAEQRELPIIAASMPVLPKHYYEKNAFDKTSLVAPVGSGPYRIAAIDAGRSITYARVPDYWAANLATQKGLNNFDTIKIDVYRDDVVALEGIKSGQFDYYEEYIARNWATAYHTPAIRDGRLIKTRIPHKIPRGMQAFMFNMRRDKFSDPSVREAIGLTMDFQWMNKTLFYNAYERNHSFFQNNAPFMATGLPTGDELALLEPWRCGESRVESRESSESSAQLNSPLAPETPSPPAGEGGGEGDSPSASRASPPPPPNLLPQGEEESRAALPQLDSRLSTLDSACLPPTVFTTPFANPETDGSGYDRGNLIRAQQLLNDSGWVMKNGKRTHAKTGEVLTVEFLMTQRTFERVVGIMRTNLRKLGIDSTFRYVDASQYQRRLDKRNFDIVSIWWNQGLNFPGSEQHTFWHSSEADKEGSQNVGGVKNPIVDDLVKRIARAQTMAQLAPAARALDRVLLANHYVIPHWYMSAWRVVYWNKFGRPDVTPEYNIGLDSWWFEPQKSAPLTPKKPPTKRGKP